MEILIATLHDKVKKVCRNKLHIFLLTGKASSKRSYIM